MFPVLSHRRIDHVLVRDPAEVPEIVAAAILGACRYLPDPARVLVPFVGLARADGAGRRLSERLVGATSAAVALWPPAPGTDGGGAPPTGGDGWTPRDPTPSVEVDPEEAPEPDEGFWDCRDREAREDQAARQAAAGGGAEDPGREPSRMPSAPDAVVTLQRPGQPPAWILIESVGADGRLSGDDLDDPGARLATHWIAARRAAGQAGVPLAVVLVTTSSSVPGALFAWARDALGRAGEPPAPLYGLSWRSFPGCARASRDGSPILADLLDLLEGAWGLAEVAMDPWPPAPVPGAAPRFVATWRWPVPPAVLPSLTALSNGGLP